ncbi:MAG: response regulator [Oscillatoria sp. SIO1A7]|nr:response regulator [Oscillatoria sp. SIO1A7]
MTTTRPKNSTLILVADDDKFTRIMLRQIMQGEKYQVEEVENGEECLAAYSKLQPDMILLDAMMPVMDGFTCCAELQGLPGGADTPILMITGLNDKASVDWAFAAGAIDYVTKPIHPPVLRQRVRRILQASRAEKALREREKQYRSVVENIKEVIFQTDAEDRLTFLNYAWTELTGFALTESLGRQIFDFIHAGDRESYQELWRSSLQAKNPEAKATFFREKVRYLTKAGDCRWMEINAYSTEATDDMATGMSGTIQDITDRCQAEILAKQKLELEADVTEQKKVAEIMRNALEKEKELGEFRSRIITRVSHEFRTPLTVILSSTEFIKKYGHKLADEKKLKHFQKVETSVQHITKLLEDAVAIGKVESGEIEFNPAELDVGATTGEIAEEFEKTLESKHRLAFTVTGDRSLANLDKKLLRLMLGHLLSNAAKYSPQGGLISFEVICEKTETIFRIKDEGVGIPPEERERLFESFHRASNAENIQGTGLGLAIVKKCASLHRGKVEVQSEEGVGTIFTVTLPSIGV